MTAAANDAVAAPIKPQRGMSSAFKPIVRANVTSELANFRDVLPVMSRTTPQIPVPVSTRFAQAKTESAAAPSTKLLPNIDRMGAGNSSTIKNRGRFIVNVHLVTVW